MEDKAKSDEPVTAKIKENAIITKMVVVVEQPDGSAWVKTFTRDKSLPKNFTLADSTEISFKEFKEIPKRLEVLFEKGFKG